MLKLQKEKGKLGIGGETEVFHISSVSLTSLTLQISLGLVTHRHCVHVEGTSMYREKVVIVSMTNKQLLEIQ